MRGLETGKYPRETFGHSIFRLTFTLTFQISGYLSSSLFIKIRSGTAPLPRYLKKEKRELSGIYVNDILAEREKKNFVVRRSLFLLL